MKRIDFENGTVTGNILGAALPMLVAQILNLLYNIVDRIYIARIPEVGTAALGGVGLCFPVIVIITAFANLFGGGGAPLFSIDRGRKKEQEATRIMNTSFSLVCSSALLLMMIGLLFSHPILTLFGASRSVMVYARPYLMVYLIGTLPCNRCSCESDFRSSVYLCIWNGGTWCGVCNCNFTVFVCIVCILFFNKKSRVKGAATKEK